MIASVVSLLVGVAIGLAPQTPTGGTAIASLIASAAPTESATSPTVEPSVAVTSEPVVVPTVEPTPAFSTPIAPVVVKGSGTQKTKPFTLHDGDYTVVIKGSGNSNVIVDLVPRGSDSGDNLFNEISDGKYSYETVAYGVTEGSYYLDVTNEAAWTVTFTSLP